MYNLGDNVTENDKSPPLDSNRRSSVTGRQVVVDHLDLQQPSAAKAKVTYRMASAQQHLQPDGFISVTSRKYR